MRPYELAGKIGDFLSKYYRNTRNRDIVARKERGEPNADIAARHNISTETVTKIIRKEVASKPKTAEQIEERMHREMCRDRRSGMSEAKISEKHGISRHHVSKILWREMGFECLEYRNGMTPLKRHKQWELGFKRQLKRKKRMERNNAIVQLINKGMSVKEVAEHVGMSTCGVRDAYKKYKDFDFELHLTNRTWEQS